MQRSPADGVGEGYARRNGPKGPSALALRMTPAPPDTSLNDAPKGAFFIANKASVGDRRNSEETAAGSVGPRKSTVVKHVEPGHVIGE